MATSQETRSDQVRTPYEKYSGYNVYDDNQDKIGKVDGLFVDTGDQQKYVGAGRTRLRGLERRH